MTFTGYLHIEVANKQSKSVISNSFFDGIFKITRPVYLSSDLPLLTLLHVGGGYVDGDSYKTEVVVHESACLALTTQASTKVYKSKGQGVTQEMDYILNDNSELYVKQDSLILYRGADFTQFTNVHMSSSSTFSYTDIITPGWSEDGAHFQYKKVVSKMRIFVDNRLEVFDHLRLLPEEGVEKMMVLEGFTHLGTMFFIHQRVNENIVEKIRDVLNDFPNVRYGVSMLSVRGLSIRILAKNTTIIERLFATCENLLRKDTLCKERVGWRKG